MELGNIVKTKDQRHGKIVKIQSSIDGRKIYVVEFTKNVSDGFFKEELEFVFLGLEVKEKSYRYMISLLTDNCYGDYIYGKFVEGDGCPVGADFTYAVTFNNVEETHEYALNKAKLKYGEYAIHGFYV